MSRREPAPEIEGESLPGRGSSTGPEGGVRELVHCRYHTWWLLRVGEEPRDGAGW